MGMKPATATTLNPYLFSGILPPVGVGRRRESRVQYCDATHMLAVLLAQVMFRGMEEISDGLERAGKASRSLLLLQQSIWILQYLHPIMRERLLVIIAGSD
jgi:hypothetical protein